MSMVFKIVFLLFSFLVRIYAYIATMSIYIIRVIVAFKINHLLYIDKIYFYC